MGGLDKHIAPTPPGLIPERGPTQLARLIDEAGIASGLSGLAIGDTSSVTVAKEAKKLGSAIKITLHRIDEKHYTYSGSSQELIALKIIRAHFARSRQPHFRDMSSEEVPLLKQRWMEKVRELLATNQYT